MSEIKHISHVFPPWPFEAYARTISPLFAQDGGGYLLTLPDLPGCMADGETEAVANGRDAFVAVVSALADMGRDIPALSFSPMMRRRPGLWASSSPVCPNRFTPNALHAPKLKACRSIPWCWD